MSISKFNWLNISDLKDWEVQAVRDYFIYATPTMLIVNGNKKIIKKPDSIEEIIPLF